MKEIKVRQGELTGFLFYVLVLIPLRLLQLSDKVWSIVFSASVKDMPNLYAFSIYIIVANYVHTFHAD